MSSKPTQVVYDVDAMCDEMENKTIELVQLRQRADTPAPFISETQYDDDGDTSGSDEDSVNSNGKRGMATYLTKTEAADKHLKMMLSNMNSLLPGRFQKEALKKLQIKSIPSALPVIVIPETPRDEVKKPKPKRIYVDDTVEEYEEEADFA